jgi:flagellar capping protein FliD
MQVSSSSENTYTSASYSNKGISGMNSGLDTEGLVKSMLNDIQTKIDKQEQKQKVLEMQQEEYREVIDKINDFRDKYFSVTGEKSLVLSSSFNSSITESSSAAVKVSATADAVEGSFDVKVSQLATEAKYTGAAVSGNLADKVKIGGDLLSNDAKKTMTIKTGDKSFEVDISGATSASDMASLINKGIQTYNRQNSDSTVNISASVGSDGKLKFSGTGASSDLSVEYDGATSLVETSKDPTFTSGKVDSSKFSEEGKDYKFKINGTDEITVNLKKDDDVAEKLQSALEGTGVTVEWTGSGDNKKLKFTGTGETLSIEALEDDEEHKNDLKSLGFTKKTEASRTSDVLVETPEINSKGKLNITFNGVSKSIALTDTDNADTFSEKLFQAFGSGISFDAESGAITAGKGKTIKITGDQTALDFVGIEGKSVANQVDTSMTLKDVFGYEDGKEVSFTLNGTDFTFNANTKLSDMMTEINESRAGVTLTYNSLNDKFSLTGQETGSGSVINAADKEGSDLLLKMFGESSFSNAGKDAIAYIDGEEVTYSGNELKYNGINLTLKKVTGEDPVVIETTRDNDKALDTIVSFVEDYNALIKDLNDRTHEKAEYKQYAPLTDAQKDEMSESEIKKWEEKSKKGLLSGDSEISKFLTEMRSVLYTKVGDKKMLSDIGIESSSDWKDYGKLTIDKDKLKDAIQNDSKGVADIFTGKNGIASRLDTACKKVANTSSGSPGALVSLAGMKGKATEKNNTINKRIDSIKDVITKLKAQYDSRKERLWKQFNSMETALGNMNSTANYFASMMGGGY